MIGRVLLAALLAGLAAGLVMGLIQHVRLTPLIIQAETFEHLAHGHGAAGSTMVEAHSHGDQVWSPADGLERTVFTTLTAMLTAAGFAAIMAGISILSGIAITPANGLIWGLCGFIAVSLAPSLGLPPVLPGTATADVNARQLWWIMTIAFTATGLWLLATRRAPWTYAAVIVLFIAPHVIGAPQAPSVESALPATLAAQFATNSLGANLVMWALIGLFLSLTLARFESATRP